MCMKYEVYNSVRVIHHYLGLLSRHARWLRNIFPVMSGFTGEDEASASKVSADAAVVATNSTPAAAEEIANVSSKHFVFYQ